MYKEGTFKKGQPPFKTSKGKELTPQWALFCKHYLINGFNASQAALSAGYSKKTYHQISVQLMAKPAIKAYLRKRMAEVEDKLDITFEKKMKLLWKSALRCYGISDEDLEKLNGGEEVKSHFKFDPSSLVSVISELNKMQGHHTPPKSIVLNIDGETEELNKVMKEFEREY